MSALTGILLFAAWPVSPFTFLIFVAFIPLLWLERKGIRRRKFFGWTYLAMVIWNAASTWWIWNATAPGAVGAILANSLLMCLPWLGFHAVRKRLGNTLGYISLVLFWLSFEYFHLQNWGLSWPWLTIGNVFAAHPDWVQWYEYTGTSGGGLWILVVNILLFQLLWHKIQRKTFHVQFALCALAVLILPVILSFIIRPDQPEPTDVPRGSSNVVIVQPNIDPYEKLTTGSFDAMLQKLIRISNAALDSNTVLVVWPETALYMENGIDEGNMKGNYFLNPLWDFLRSHPRINLLTGIESYRMFNDSHSGTARKIPETDKYIEGYNAAVILDSSGPAAFYHKSRLVPGVETLPPFLHILDAWFEKLGGTTTGYTGQDERTVMKAPNGSYRIAPAVCYESIYGEFISRYVHNGANVIAIITNDGWWGNTPGYRQHENYARLRAIETRRWVMRSANTGVSCIIDPSGAITEFRPWLEAASIRAPIPAVKGMTFYVKFGDVLSKLAILLTILFFVWNIITTIKTRTGRG